MEEFVPLDWNIHKEEYIQLNIELLTWTADQIRENYQLDAVHFGFAQATRCYRIQSS